jgi:cytochrome c-type biogenesis protein
MESYTRSAGNQHPWRRGLPGVLALGLVSGLVASQCATPVLLAILTYVMVQQAAIGYGAALLFVYALGRGVPIVLAGTFTAALKGLRQAGRWSAALEAASGVIMMGDGVISLMAGLIQIHKPRVWLLLAGRYFCC